MFANSDELLKYIKDEHVEMIDVRFCDLPGIMQHFTVPVSSFDESVFKDGLGFDGSSIRGFQAINESDMSLFPDPTTAYIDPFRVAKTLAVNFFIHDPITGEAYSRDPRNIAKKALAYLDSTGIADTAYFAPEAEFYIFDSVRYSTGVNESYYHIDSIEGWWNSGKEGDNLGYKTRLKGGYFPVAPYDHYTDLRDQMVANLERSGLLVERAHHEVGTAGQAEINYRFDTLLKAADDAMKFKYIIKNTAWENSKSVTFMPKPIFGDNGSGMHVHMSIWKDGKPQFAGDKYAGLSQECLWYIGGIIKHAKAINAFANSTTNSYKRLVPGYEAPVKLAYSARNRSASIRIPHVSSPKAKRLEARFPDPMGNPYLTFVALLMAGLDGIENRIDPGAPADKNLYDLPPEERGSIPEVAGSLKEALDALDADRAFLKKGGVMDDDFIDSYIELKMEEVARLQLHPHPVEFDMYYSC